MDHVREGGRRHLHSLDEREDKRSDPEQLSVPQHRGGNSRGRDHGVIWEGGGEGEEGGEGGREEGREERKGRRGEGGGEGGGERGEGREERRGRERRRELVYRGQGREGGREVIRGGGEEGRESVTAGGRR